MAEQQGAVARDAGVGLYSAMLIVARTPLPLRPVKDVVGSRGLEPLDASLLFRRRTVYSRLWRKEPGARQRVYRDLRRFKGRASALG
jgi:hypothetical protein